jgi:uncharacterized membrane protein YccC
LRRARQPLVFVRELSPNLVELVRALTQRADRFVTALLDPDANRARVAEDRSALINNYVTAFAMQQSTYFESAEARILAQPLRRLTQGAVELCATAEAVASHCRRSKLDTQSVPRAVQSLETNHSPPQNEATLTSLIRAADDRDIAFARTRLLDSLAALDRGDELPKSIINNGLWSDRVSAALTGIRSGLAVLITSAFWFVTAWPSGPVAVVIVANACSVIASLEQPDKVSMAAAGVVLVAAVPAFVTQFYLLPLAVDFTSMAAALAPLTLICALTKLGIKGLSIWFGRRTIVKLAKDVKILIKKIECDCARHTVQRENLQTRGPLMPSDERVDRRHTW